MEKIYRGISIFLFVVTLFVPIIMIGVSIESTLYHALYVVGYVGALLTLGITIFKNKKWFYVAVLFVGMYMVAMYLDNRELEMENAQVVSGFHEIAP